MKENKVKKYNYLWMICFVILMIVSILSFIDNSRTGYFLVMFGFTFMLIGTYKLLWITGERLEKCQQNK